MRGRGVFYLAPHPEEPFDYAQGKLRGEGSLMKLFYITLIITVVIVTGSAGYAASKNVAFSITLDKDKYEKSDPIPITFTLKNKGNEPVYINKRFFLNSEESRAEEREVYLVVISPKGKRLKIKRSLETGLPKSDYFVLIEPNKEVSSKRASNIKHRYDFNEPGEYTITAVYKNVFGDEIGLSAFKGEVKSKPKKIKIAE